MAEAMESTIPEDQQAFCEVLDEMTSSVSSARASLKNVLAKQDLDMKDGISMLSLKHHLQLSYLQSLVLLSAHRVLGHALADRTGPPEPFGAAERSKRGSSAGDLVDSMVEGRIVLEKIRALESKMHYQIDKLIRLAEEAPAADGDNAVINDPLAFKPNPQNLMNQDVEDSRQSSAEEDDVPDNAPGASGIYRPPKLAPMPYTDAPRGKRERRPLIPTALTQLSALAHNPHLESSTGTGAAPPALQSARARELARLTEFEEENFTRLVMKKRDARRRRNDEEDIALGGAGLSGGGRRRAPGAGLEDDFADVLRAVDRRTVGPVGDGYEELRRKGRREDTLTRARKRAVDPAPDEGPRERKKGRFEKSRLALKKKLSNKSRR